MMTQAEFHNGLRRLLNLDHSDLPFLSKARWKEFRNDPFRFFILTDDVTAAKIWGVMEGD